MSEQKPVKSIIWDKFTQIPTSPEIGDNPVTKVLNMELSPYKTIRTRKNFKSIGNYSDKPENQIVTSLRGNPNPYLIYKEGNSIKIYDGAEFNTLTPSGLHYSNIKPDTEGTFSVFGGELYYCESTSPAAKESALFAWDGSGLATGFRNLGVPGMTGKIPDTVSGGEDKTVTICSAKDFTTVTNTCGCACAFEEGTKFYVFPDGECADQAGELNDTCPCYGTDIYMQCALAMPGFVGIFCWSVPSECEGGNAGRGEKILNCAFRVGLYDPKRNTFGRACDPKAVINFGRQRSQFSMFQYQILVDLADFDKNTVETAGYRIAVWCTPGVEVLDYKHWMPVGNLMLTGNSHAMSEFLGGQTFLEGIYNARGGGNPEIEGCPSGTDGKLCLYKDQTLLVNSGAYMNTYDRPVPSKAMCIIGNTALYFYPINQDITSEPYTRSDMSSWDSHIDEQYENLAGNSYRYGAEYSVGHPEQIGRYTDSEETFTPIPYLKGDPVRVFNDAGNNIMLTRQGLYSVGFNKGAQLQDLGGPGILTGKSFHPTSSGVMYVGDEGPVWLQGGKAVSVIRQLGFDGWIDDLSSLEKEEIRIGFIEDSKKILVSFPIPGASGSYRYLMHDVETSFTSEWWIGTGQNNDPDSSTGQEYPPLSGEGTKWTPEYMSSFRSNYGYKFLLFANNSIYKYNEPGSGGDSRISVVEMWINENSNITKQLGMIVADLGSCKGGMVIRVSTFDSPRQFKSSSEEPTDTRELDLSESEVQNRMLLSRFMGMRGKYIRIRFETKNSTSSRVEVAKVVADITYDDSPSSIGEPPVDGLTPA